MLYLMNAIANVLAALFLAPIFVGILATFAALFLAHRIAAAAESPIVADDSAEWIASFEAFEVDAEWIALADAAAIEDAAIAVMAEGCRAMFRASLPEAIKLAASRKHGSEANTVARGALTSGRKLTSADVDAFEARERGIAMGEACSVDADALRFDVLDMLTTLAARRYDASECAAAWEASQALYLEALALAFESPEDAAIAAA